MLVVADVSRRENRRRVVTDLRRPGIPVRLSICPAGLHLESLSWREHWQPCKAFFSADARLVQRLNRLKAAWRNLSRVPQNRRCQLAYCWRYFGLLHHTFEIASCASPGEAIPYRCFVVFSLSQLSSSGGGDNTEEVLARSPLSIPCTSSGGCR